MRIDNLTPEQYRALLRNYLCAFIQRCFKQLNPQTALAMNWHIEVIAAKLEACRRGEIRRLIINVPPRHLKSLCASVAFPAWILGLDPAAQILCASYAQDFADKLARDCRSVMTSSWYKATFPTRLASDFMYCPPSGAGSHTHCSGSLVKPVKGFTVPFAFPSLRPSE